MGTNYSVVLLSGGLDSATCLAYASQESNQVYALNAYYGQKHDKEIQCARKLADIYGAGYWEVDLSQIFVFSECPLLKRSTKKIQHKSYAEQLQDLGGEGTVSTYVPFRNGLLLSTAVAFAMSWGAQKVWYGAHKDDAAGRAYPDCTPEFVDAMNQAIKSGTGGEVELVAPFMDMTKAEIVKFGLAAGVPYEYTWSCYEGGDKPCGTCGTCRDRAKAFELNGVPDPALQ